jgi:hypothetical protein
MMPRRITGGDWAVTLGKKAFDREVLKVIEDRSDPNRPIVTIHAGGEAGPSLAVPRVIWPAL